MGPAQRKGSRAAQGVLRSGRSRTVTRGPLHPWARRRPPVLPYPPVCTRTEGDSMDDLAVEFLELIHRFEEVRDAITPERAHAEFDETTLQLFWKKWPSLSIWSGSLWRMLSQELAGPATPHLDADLDEVGGSE